MASNLPVKQFTKALRGLPDVILLEMCAAITSAGVEPLPKPHNRGRMIKYVVEHKEKLQINQLENPDDIEDRKEQVVGFTILMRIIINICAQKCSKYTAGTLRFFIHLFYDITTDDKAVLFKSNLSGNLLTFSQYITDKDEFLNIYHFKEKFKELVFDVIEKDIINRVYAQAGLLAGTHAFHTEGNDNKHKQFRGKNSEKLIIYSLCNANLDGFDDDSFDFSPDIDEPSDTLPQFVNASDMSLSSPPSSPTPVAPVAPAPAPAPAPVDNTNIQAPVSPTPEITYLDWDEPIVKVVSDPDEWDLIMLGEQLDENNDIVKLSFLGELSKSKINKTSWNKLRKKHNLEGRWNIYIAHGQTLGHNPKQNQNLKYQKPLSVDPSWQNAYLNLDNEPVTDFPYGTIYLLSEKRPLPPPS
jgi:hypothetical protein